MAVREAALAKARTVCLPGQVSADLAEAAKLSQAIATASDSRVIGTPQRACSKKPSSRRRPSPARR